VYAHDTPLINLQLTLLHIDGGPALRRHWTTRFSTSKARRHEHGSPGAGAPRATSPTRQSPLPATRWTGSGPSVGPTRSGGSMGRLERGRARTWSP